MLKTVGVFALCALAWVTSAQGAYSNNYGMLNGVSVDYLDITESNDGSGPLFGAPAIAGDTLDFDPIGFAASSSGNSLVDGQLNFAVKSKSATPISKLVLDESGDFTLQGLGNASAQATVGTTVQVKVVEVGGVAQFIDGGQFTMTFTPVGSGGNGSFKLPGDAGTAVPWKGHLDIDVSAISPNATKIEVVLDNALTALGADGGVARIAKKDFSGLVINLPEPSAASLVLVLVTGCGMLRRRFVA